VHLSFPGEIMRSSHLKIVPARSAILLILSGVLLLEENGPRAP
jgi:hypothetical protein